MVGFISIFLTEDNSKGMDLRNVLIRRWKQKKWRTNSAAPERHPRWEFLWLETPIVRYLSICVDSVIQVKSTSKSRRRFQLASIWRRFPKKNDAKSTNNQKNENCKHPFMWWVQPFLEFWLLVQTWALCCIIFKFVENRNFMCILFDGFRLHCFVFSRGKG